MILKLSTRWLAEFGRRPLNLILLIVVPLVFVTLSAGVLADFADILGGLGEVGNIEAATAGWAAAVLAGVSGFFHVSTSRNADRRLAEAGVGAIAVVASRLISTLALAAVSTLGALIALGVRTNSGLSWRVVGATILFSLIYVGIGVAVGALIESEMNGSLLVVFIWIFDVFFGPAMGGVGRLSQFFPLYYPTSVITSIDSGTAGLLGDLGLSGLIVVLALGVAVLALAMTTRSGSFATKEPPPFRRRIYAAQKAAFRQLQRMPIMWILVVGLPAAFISESIAVTPNSPTPVELAEAGARTLQILPMDEVHGAIMVPITVGFLASLAGLFVIVDSAEVDQRLSLTPFRPLEILWVRFVVIMSASLLATAISLLVTSLSFRPASWPIFVGANLLVALTYATIGVIAGPVFGRLGGIYVLLILPFVDIGLAQNPMFDAAPPTWGRFLPGHGAVRVMMDGAFTQSFDEGLPLFLALVWLVCLGVISTIVFRRVALARVS